MTSKDNQIPEDFIVVLLLLLFVFVVVCFVCVCVYVSVFFVFQKHYNIFLTWQIPIVTLLILT